MYGTDEQSQTMVWHPNILGTSSEGKRNRISSCLCDCADDADWTHGSRGAFSSLFYLHSRANSLLALTASSLTLANTADRCSNMVSLSIITSLFLSLVALAAAPTSVAADDAVMTCREGDWCASPTFTVKPDRSDRVPSFLRNCGSDKFSQFLCKEGKWEFVRECGIGGGYSKFASTHRSAVDHELLMYHGSGPCVTGMTFAPDSYRTRSGTNAAYCQQELPEPKLL